LTNKAVVVVEVMRGANEKEEERKLFMSVARRNGWVVGAVTNEKDATLEEGDDETTSKPAAAKKVYPRGSIGFDLI